MIPIGETQDGRADMTNFEMDLFDTRMSNYKADKDEEQCCRIIKPACLPITIVSLFIITLVFLPLFNEEDLEAPTKLSAYCDASCNFQIVESIPTGLTFTSGDVHNRTHLAWIDLIDNAQNYIDIAALYWNLNESDYKTSIYGKSVFQSLINAGKRGVRIRIAQDVSKGLSSNSDSKYLLDHKLAEVRTLNFSRLVGSGVLHTKFIIVDLKNIYLGSANMDWKSLSEVKELGFTAKDCPCLATDLFKIFAVYWRLGEDAKIPDKWPISYRTTFNIDTPMPVMINNQSSQVFLSSSPGPFNPKGRAHDLDAIKYVMEKANRFVYVAVMDFLPQTLYMQNNSYWPALDDALRSAAFNGKHVHLLISNWAHSRPSEIVFLKSLIGINGALKKGSIKVKLFTVPATKEQSEIPFARVNHNKYMVSDVHGYIGTSNWAGDYFITTAGVGFIVETEGENNIRQQLQSIFERDWNSEYAQELV
ncbi:unnamed protein product [Auanema sp. JU1783]|nr:unnamed protein product [Auanema sp. JU1783]